MTEHRHKPLKELKDAIKHRHINDARVLAEKVMEEQREYAHILSEGPLYKLAKAFILLDEKNKENKYKALAAQKRADELEAALDSLHRGTTKGSCCGPDGGDKS